MSLFLKPVKKIARKIYDLLDELYLRATVKHVYGPKKIKYGKNEVIAICFVRDSGFFIKSFIEHYFSLGVKHIVFLDNGSVDNTISIACGYKNITILRSKIFFGAEGLTTSVLRRAALMKDYLAGRFCRHRWCLVVDADELFDYPFSGVIKLDSLLEYLNNNSYTAVISHMLDMFSDKPLSEQEDMDERPVGEIGQYYDITGVRKEDYFDRVFSGALRGYSLSNKNIKFYSGGIREAVFGTPVWLTKHSLVFAERIKFLSAHWVSNVRCADFSAVCFHYKLVGDFYKRTLKHIQAGCISKKTSAYDEYAAIISKCEDSGVPLLKRETAKKLNSADDLIENGFLTVSENYMNWAHRCAGKITCKGEADEKCNKI